MGAEKKDIWDRGDGFNLGLNSPKQTQQLLDGLAGHSDGSLHGQLGAQVRRDSQPRQAATRPGKGGSIAGFLLVIVLIAVFAGGNDSTPRAPGRASPPVKSTEAVPASRASMAQVDRFVVQQPLLRAGQTLKIFVDWTPDVAGALADLEAFAITRDAHQRRTPLGRVSNAYSGPSVISFTLPNDLPPGKYEIEVVWSFGSPPVESRDNFQVSP